MKKTTAEMIEVMKAYEEGKKIEHKSKDGDKWFEVSAPSWNWRDYDYRVKEEPKYRPYVDTEEMINDFCERFGVKRTNFGEPFIWIMHKTCKRLIISYDVNSVYVQYCSEIENITMQELLDNFTYLDGSICGVINC